MGDLMVGASFDGNSDLPKQNTQKSIDEKGSPSKESETQRASRSRLSNRQNTTNVCNITTEQLENITRQLEVIKKQNHKLRTDNEIRSKDVKALNELIKKM